jgi:hypothetical protein
MEGSTGTAMLRHVLDDAPAKSHYKMGRSSVRAEILSAPMLGRRVKVAGRGHPASHQACRVLGACVRLAEGEWRDAATALRLPCECSGLGVALVHAQGMP